MRIASILGDPFAYPRAVKLVSPVPLVSPFKLAAWPRLAGSQNSEAALAHALGARLGLDPSFVEFGFHAFEFNCAALAKAGWHGLLLDAGAREVRLMRVVRFLHRLRGVRCARHLVAPDALAPIEDFVRARGGRLGFLSV